MSPYAPLESPAMLWFEQSLEAGVFIGAIAYGGHIAVFCTCVYHLVHEKTISWRWLAFVSTLFAMGTTNIICNIHYNEMTYIDDRNYPGGPLAFLFTQQALPVDTVGNAAYIIASVLADSLLIYRCYIVWYGMWWIVILPILMLLASTSLGILVVLQDAQPNGTLWAQSTLNFSIPFFSISMSLTVSLTIAIVLRLIRMRRRIRSILGTEHGSTYTGVAAMVVESALPFAAVCLIFLALYAKGNTGANLFLPLLVQVQGISPQLIVLRVQRGRAWSKGTLSNSRMSGLKFAAPSPPGSSSLTESTQVPSNISSSMIFRDPSSIGQSKGSPSEGMV
ncbi:hypothetical protein BJ138DRAFT_1021282 [Hygrophoropsis aurantiaca]|uniref:Uncharacterized protein n=1 Tax=Hygrophoropsis aurantiaca TaxID=72124 RepID=A0ACB7ZQ54_9AGAM|nr:hypothetical protein BJ138DRAFT_1021282 [Hygrophoropsis aurantiaca]